MSKDQNPILSIHIHTIITIIIIFWKLDTPKFHFLYSWFIKKNLDLNFHLGIYPIYRHTQMKGIHFTCNFQIFSFTIHNSLATLKPHLRPTVFLTTHTACTRLEWHWKNDVGWGNNKRCKDKSYKQCRAPDERWQKEFNNSGNNTVIRFRIKKMWNGSSKNPLIHHLNFLRDHFQDTEGWCIKKPSFGGLTPSKNSKSNPTAPPWAKHPMTSLVKPKTKKGFMDLHSYSEIVFYSVYTVVIHI